MNLSAFPGVITSRGGGGSGGCKGEGEGAIVGSEAGAQHVIVGGESGGVKAGSGREGANEGVPEEGTAESEGAVVKEAEGGSGVTVVGVGEEDGGGGGKVAGEDAGSGGLGMSLLRVGKGPSSQDAIVDGGSDGIPRDGRRGEGAGGWRRSREEGDGEKPMAGEAHAGRAEPSAASIARTEARRRQRSKHERERNGETD